MIIGIPKESKENEYRVSMTPGGVRELVSQGHTVYVQKNAGLGSGFKDQDYVVAGASLADGFRRTIERCDLVIKVKEPSLEEVAYFREGQILFTYLHLAANPKLVNALIRRKVTALGYETVEMGDHSLPLLRPMSEIAGRLAAQVGAHYLTKDNGGKGKLLAGIPGVEPGTVTVLGAGVVGSNAIQIATGLGAQVIVLDSSPEKLNRLKETYGEQITTIPSSSSAIEGVLTQTDLLIGAVLIPGAKAPKLVTRSMLKLMEPGSVIVDVAVDQGGCIETSKPTTHQRPTFLVDGIIHYGVSNMPGCVPRTATQGLTRVTLPYILKLAHLGLEKALIELPELKKGVNVWKGEVRLGWLVPGIDQAESFKG